QIENDANVSLSDKHFVLFRELRNRIAEHQRVLFQARKIETEMSAVLRAENDTINNLASELTANQAELVINDMKKLLTPQELNNLQWRFRSDVREKLKLSDASYIVKEPPKKVKPIQRGKLLDRMVKDIAVRYNISIEDAEKKVKLLMGESNFSIIRQ